MKIYMELSGNASSLKNAMRQSKSAVSDFVKGAKREAAELRGVFDSMNARLAALGLSAGIGFKLWQSAGLDKSLTQIGQTAGDSAKSVAELRNDLFRLGKESGQDVDNLKEGFNVLIQTGLNMKESRETLKGLNTAMAVTGAEAKTLANGLTVAATAFQFDLAKPGQALLLLDKMTVAGRLGNAELQNLSDIFARVGVNAKAAGMSFEQTLGFIEALSMVERQPERLATLADSTLRLFTNFKYLMKGARGTGVRFFDAQGERRNTSEVLNDIRAKVNKFKSTARKEKFISKAFGETDYDTVKGLRMLFDGKNLDKVNEFAQKIEKAGGTLKRDFDDATRNLVDQTGRLKAALRESADEFAKPINKVLADLMKWVMANKKEGGMGLSGKEIMGYGTAGVLGTWALARYGAKAIEWMRGVPGGKIAGGAVDLLKGKAATAAGIAEGKAIQAVAGVTPVFVVNWPAEGIISKGQSALKTAGEIGAAAGGAAAMSRAGIVWASIKSGLGLIGAQIMKHTPLFLPRQVLVPALAGYGAGWLLNKGAGAMSDLISGGRYKGSGWLGNMYYDWRHTYSPVARQEKTEVKNNIQLNIKIDKDDRVFAASNDPGTSTNISLDRGEFTLQ